MNRMTIRLPEALKAWIAQEANKHGRTLNSEIVEMLRELQQVGQAKEAEQQGKAA